MITSTKKGEWPEGLVDALKKFHGLPPYHGSSNIVAGDGYFMMSLHLKYGNDMVRRCQDKVVLPLQRTWHRVCKRFAVAKSPKDFEWRCSRGG